MAEVYEMHGKRFERLVVLSRVENDANGNARWLCLCDCGSRFEAKGFKIRLGTTKSCGCLKRIRPAAKTHGMSDTRLFRVWAGMKTRCNNKNCANWHRYGGRGITVCPDWNASFAVFMSWALSNGYSDHLSIDRIDNNGNYEPSNCKWSNRSEQAMNTSRSLTEDGRSMGDVAASLSVSRATISRRINEGWSYNDAISVPNLKPWSKNRHSQP